jgi:ACR3 family arsenite transporter
VYAWIFVTALPPVLGLPSLAVDLGIGELFQSVMIYLGIPFAAGLITRAGCGGTRATPGTERFLPRTGKITRRPVGHHHCHVQRDVRGAESSYRPDTAE